jgi:hypothetical protein
LAILKPTARMRINLLTLLLLISSFSGFGQNKMENIFITWDNFVDGFGREMVSAEDVFNNMVKSGAKSGRLWLCCFQ